MGIWWWAIRIRWWWCRTYVRYWRWVSGDVRYWRWARSPWWGV